MLVTSAIRPLSAFLPLTAPEEETISSTTVAIQSIRLLVVRVLIGAITQASTERKSASCEAGTALTGKGRTAGAVFWRLIRTGQIRMALAVPMAPGNLAPFTKMVISISAIKIRSGLTATPTAAGCMFCGPETTYSKEALKPLPVMALFQYPIAARTNLSLTTDTGRERHIASAVTL